MSAICDSVTMEFMSSGYNIICIGRFAVTLHAETRVHLLRLVDKSQVGGYFRCVYTLK